MNKIRKISTQLRLSPRYFRAFVTMLTIKVRILFDKEEL
jgi:hypothetical protein